MERDKDMEREKGILVFIEINDGRLHRVSYELLNKAKELQEKSGESISCLVMGNSEPDLAELNFRGADAVYYMEDACFGKPEEMLYKENILEFVKEHKPSILLTGATNFGRSLAPRVAAALGTGLTADCTDLQINEEGRMVQIRPAFSDNILAHIKTSQNPQMATVRYKEFSEAKRDLTRDVNIYRVAPYVKTSKGTDILKIFSEEHFDISAAEVVVAGGRGIKRKEDLLMLEELAKLLNGKLGVSRALVDAGMIGSAHQVGYSGNRVKPRLYIACGISGAPQHLAGMKESDCIIAVNSDASAPIFSFCDVGFVGDLYKIVPEMIEEAKNRRKEATI